MKQRLKKVALMAVALALAGTMSACDILLDTIPTPNFPVQSFSDRVSSSEDNEPPSSTSSSSNSSSSSEWISSENSSSEGSSENSSINAPDSSVEENDSSAADPDPDKELLKLETDALGHEIAYYADGSWDDLGRVKPIDFTPDTPETKYGYQSFEKASKSKGLCGLYKELFERSKAFFASSQNVALDGNGYHSLSAVDTKPFGLTMDEMTSVWAILKQDYPEFYWLSNEIYTYGDDLFLCVDADYAQGSVRTQTQAKIEEAVLECDVYVNGVMSEAERALTVHDYIVAEIDYAYDAKGVPVDEAWAHNIAGWATQNSGVCETYAETFAYLCNLFDVQSVVVVGQAATESGVGPHAWNILKLENEWYTVDVTWNDGFAAESKLASREWFGMPASEFSASHAADLPEYGWGSNYQFALPTLSERALSPVHYKDSSGKESWCVSIDMAFEKMTDEGGRYEITLYPESKALLDRGITLYPDGARFTAQLPKVGSLTFKGNFIYTDEEAGWGYMPTLTYQGSALVLNSEITVNCIYFYLPEMVENGFSINERNNAKIYYQTAV